MSEENQVSDAFECFWSMGGQADDSRLITVSPKARNQFFQDSMVGIQVMSEKILLQALKEVSLAHMTDDDMVQFVGKCRALAIRQMVGHINYASKQNMKLQARIKEHYRAPQLLDADGKPASAGVSIVTPA